MLVSLLATLSVLILAQAEAGTSLPDPKSSAAVGWLFVALGGLAVTANQILDVFRKLFPKQTPPNHELYATKSELAKLEQDHEEEMKRIEGRFEKWLDQNDTHHKTEIRVLTEWKDEMVDWRTDLAEALGKLQAMFELAKSAKGGK